MIAVEVLPHFQTKDVPANAVIQVNINCTVVIAKRKGDLGIC